MSIDLVLDPIASSSFLVTSLGDPCYTGDYLPGDAVGLGFWVWCVPTYQDTHYYGVPLSNFFGWMVVIAG